MEPRREPSEESLAAVRAALADHRREVAAGRWVAFGSLLLFGAGFAALAGIAAGLAETRLGVGPRGRRVAMVCVFAAQAVLLALVGGARGEGAATAPPLGWFVLLGRAFTSAWRLAFRVAPSPRYGIAREAALLLDLASDPVELARRVGAGGKVSAQALALLESLGLLRHRSLRRAASDEPRAANAQQDGANAADHALVRPRPFERQRAVEVGGIREAWVWASGEAATELHVAAFAGSVVARHGHGITCLGPDGGERWARATDPGTSCVHVAPDGALVALLADSGVLTLLAGATGERLAQVDVGAATSAVTVTVGGARIWIADRFGQVTVLDGRGRELRRVSVEHPVDFLAVASETEVAVAASRRGHLSSIDEAGERVRRSFVRSDVARAWIEEDGERALIVAPAEGVLAWDLSGGSLETYALDRALRDAAADAPGDRLAAVTFDDRLVLLDAAARVLWQCNAPPGTSQVRMSADARQLWCLAGTGAIHQLEVLDRGATERRVVDLDAAVATTPPLESPTPVPEPAPGGFRQVRIVPKARALVLLHPEGRVAVGAAQGTQWRVTQAFGSGVGDCVSTGEGSALAMIVDRGVVRVSLADGAARVAPCLASRLAAVPNGPELLAATTQGELWLVDEVRERRIPVDVTGLAHLAVVAHGGSWQTWWTRRDGAVQRVALDGSAHSIGELDDLVAPVRLVALDEQVLLVDAGGAFRWLDPLGDELGRGTIAVPVVSAERAGPGAVAVADRLGNVHLVSAGAGVAGVLARPQGLLRVGCDAEGTPWLLRAHRQLLICQGWDGSLRAQHRFSGTPIDLAGDERGGWALLTAAGLFAHGLEPTASNERAHFLEL
ncbi:MAG: hypothetical protein U0610_00970 [bacterium]